MQPVAAARTTRTRTTQINMSSNPTVPKPVASVIAASALEKRQRSQVLQSREAEYTSSNSREDDLESELMDLDDIRVDESLTAPPPTSTYSIDPILESDLPTSRQTETPPNRKEPRSAFNHFSAALENVTTTAALATPAPPFPGGFNFKFPTPKLHPRFSTSSLEVLPSSDSIPPTLDIVNPDLKPAINAIATIPLSPVRPTQISDQSTHESPRQRAYNAIHSLATDTGGYDIESLLLSKKPSKLSASMNGSSSAKAGVVGGMKGKKRAVVEVELAGEGKEKKIARAGEMKDVGSLSKSTSSSSEVSVGVSRASLSSGAVESGEKMMRRGVSNGAKKITVPAKRARPAPSLRSDPLKDQVDDAPIRPVTKASRIAKPTSTANLASTTRIGSTSRSSHPTLPFDAAPHPTVARTRNSIPKPGSVTTRAPARSSAGVSDVSTIKRPPIVLPDFEDAPPVKRPTRATRASSKK